MDFAPARGLLAHLRQVPDPRGRHGRRHSLEAMLASIVCAILCGARGYQEIADWIHAQEPATWHAIGFTRRPPKVGGFRYLLVQLCPEAFEAAVRRWIEELLGAQQSADQADLRVIAIDGKSLCGTFSEHTRAVHLLAALDQQTGFVLSQKKMSSKTNEHKVAWPLLRELVLKGCLITGDAMFCQRDLCRKIVGRKGHYLFQVKDNQRNLLNDIQAEFTPAFSPQRSTPAA